jgi:hypothetical protein
MSGGKRVISLALCAALVLMVSVPLFAADRDTTKADLNGISPKRHRYIFNVVGGLAVGAGIGALLGGAPSVTKGMLIGGGGASAWYLHSHPNAAGNMHNWAHLASYTALGSGLGWTLCKCGDGAGWGALMGGGASALWLANAPEAGRNTRVDHAPKSSKLDEPKVTPEEAGLTMAASGTE